MTTNPIRDALHALECFEQERESELDRIATLKIQLDEARQRLRKAVMGAQTCRDKLKELGAE